MNKTFPATPLINRNGVPTKSFRQLLELTNIVATDFDEILRLTQEQWRVHGKMPKDIDETEECARIADRAMPLFRQLGVISVPRLEPGSRSWLAIYGATYVAIHKRFARAVALWNEGVTWTNTAYLASRRVLDPVKESPDVLTKPIDGGLPFVPSWRAPDVLPATEAELYALVLSQVGHHRRWRQDREFFPVAEDESGKPAGTDGTLRACEGACDLGGSGLIVVSSQPHILRQGFAASRIVGKYFTDVEATGYDVPTDKVIVARTLDDLAKFLFDIAQAAA